MTYLYNKFKDDTPINTVNRIKGIYKSLNLSMNYTIEKHIDGVYSSYLYDINGNWNTAGKGTTGEFCLASAYGESIEHLCNHFAFDISKTSKRAKEHEGFLRYYDEVMLPVEQIKNIAPCVFDDMCNCYGKDEAWENIADVWKSILSSEQTPFVPYFNISRMKVELLPEAVLSKLCGSNGGGSGNTPEEAIGHALDEAIERYVKYQIVFHKLTPPTIPMSYIQEICPDIFELIRNIQEQGRFSIIVKDASLGKGFTVICILVIDNQRQS